MPMTTFHPIPKISSVATMDREQPTPALRRAASTLQVQLEHPAALYVASLAPGSRRSTVDALRRAARFFGGAPAGILWHELGFAHMTALRAHLAERHAPATCNRVLSAVRGVLRFAVRLGLMGRMEMLNAVDVGSVKGSRELAGRALTPAELAAMFANARAGAPGKRDRCLLALMCGGGFRRAEVAALNLSSVEPGGEALRVRGKGNKERIVPLPPAVAGALRDWLEVRGSAPGPLIYSLAYRQLTTNRISAPGIYCVLELLAERAGIAHFSPHDLRRTYISELLDANVDIKTVADLVGHNHIGTTARYDRRPERARRAAVLKLRIPIDGTPPADGEA